LSLGREVRLKNAYIKKWINAAGTITSTTNMKKAEAEVGEASQRKVAGTLHCGSYNSRSCLYDPFIEAHSHKEKNFLEFMNKFCG
jgi:hypothetical protein